MSPDFPVAAGTSGINHDGGYGYNDAFVARITPGGLLAWASYLGGYEGDQAYAIACDGSGNAWVTGATTSTDFPVLDGFCMALHGYTWSDAFVARISPSGSLAWASYLGGNNPDTGYGIACDSAGNAWVVGNTTSTDFPVSGGFTMEFQGLGDAFVARISPSGTLDWASYLGGSGVDVAYAIAFDGSGSAWVVGETSSDDFPVSGGFAGSLQGLTDTFMARITPGGAFAWGSYLGGSREEAAYGIALDGSSNAWMTGNALSSDFPVPGGFRTGNDRGFQEQDAFVSKITGGAGLFVVTQSLADGQPMVAYSQTLIAQGGESPYTWSISSGSLPSGLSLDTSSGVISGTPITEGISNFTVHVADSQSPALTAEKALGIVISNGPTYYFVASDNEQSTTSTSYVGKVTVNFTPPASDDWVIFGFCEFRCSNVDYATYVQMFVDGVGEGQNTRKPVDTVDYMPFITLKKAQLAAGAHTVQLMYRTGNSAGTAYIRRARVCAVRKAALECYNVAVDNAVALTTALQDITSLTWTPAAEGDYLVISTAEVNATTTVSTDVQTLYNGTVNDEGIIRAADNGDFTSFMSFNYLGDAPAGVPIVHKITAMKVTSDPINHYVRRARILALRLTGGRFAQTAAAYATEHNTTQTTFQQCLTKTWTYGVNGNWLLLNSARMTNDATDYKTEVRVQLNDSTTCGRQLMKPKDVTDLLNYSSIDVQNLTTPRKVDMDYRTTNAEGTAKVKRLRFYGLPLDAM